MNRRRFLALGGTIAVTVSAGCVGDGADDTTETDTARDDTEPTSWEDDVDFERPVDREIFVEARRYEFIPGSNEPIRANVGETIGMAMTSTDNGYHAGHGIGIREHDVRLEATEHEVDHTVFTAEEPGEFEIWCTIPCSDGHTGMTGTFVVEA